MQTSTLDFLPPAGSRALVTGATGFCGSRLTRKLVYRGVRVQALVRPGSDRRPLSDLGLKFIFGDIGDPASVQKAVAGVNHVFHLASCYRQSGATAADHHRVHVIGTRLLARAAERESALERFVHISTVGVHGHISKPPADERYAFGPGDAYQTTKAAAELWIRRFAARTGLPVTVMRPAAIYGPGDRRLFKVFKMVQGGWFPVVGHGNGLFHLIHVDDLTDAILRAAVHPGAQGQVFICADDHHTTLKEMVNVIGAALNRRVRMVRMPVLPVMAVALLCELVCRPLRLPPPLFRRRVAFYTKDRAFDNRKIREQLGFRPRYDSRRGLTELAHWYVDRGWLPAATTGRQPQQAGGHRRR